MAMIKTIDGVSYEMTPEEEAAFWASMPKQEEFVPRSASKLGLKRALDEIGRWQEVKAMIEADPEAAEDWSLAVEIRSDDPMFTAFVASGAFQQEEIDAVFRRAVGILS